jgi:HSP20 family protein
MRGLGGHPFFQNLREQAENYRAAPGQDNNNSNNDHADPDAFVPPVDVFNTERDFVLHVALPGAKKEHIGVNWDPDSSVLNIAGVVHRPGDEDFLRTLSAGERKVGVFERNVTLPPAGAEKDEIDGDAITAKMEDGVLIITVPKVEKEWTEIRKVDIE